MGMAKLWMFGLHAACWIDLSAPSTFPYERLSNPTSWVDLFGSMRWLDPPVMLLLKKTTTSSTYHKSSNSFSELFTNLAIVGTTKSSSSFDGQKACTHWPIDLLPPIPCAKKELILVSKLGSLEAVP